MFRLIIKWQNLKKNTVISSYYTVTTHIQSSSTYVQHSIVYIWPAKRQWCIVSQNFSK